MKRRSIKYIGLVLLCVAGCMFMAACGQDKESAVRNDEGSVLSSETEAKDVEKSTDPADYEIGTRDQPEGNDIRPHLPSAALPGSHRMQFAEYGFHRHILP